MAFTATNSKWRKVPPAVGRILGSCVFAEMYPACNPFLVHSRIGTLISAGPFSIFERQAWCTVHISWSWILKHSRRTSLLSVFQVTAFPSLCCLLTVKNWTANFSPICCSVLEHSSGYQFHSPLATNWRRKGQTGEAQDSNHMDQNLPDTWDGWSQRILWHCFL